VTVPRPSRTPRRTSVISPLVLGDMSQASPSTKQMVLSDDQDRRVVLIELRLERGAIPATVRREFLRLFSDVFGTTGNLRTLLP
jgi:hypothetical protein